MLEKLVQANGTSGRLGVELFWGRSGLLVPTSSDLSQLVYQDRILQHTPVLWAASAIGQINIAASFGARLCIADELDQVSLGRNRAVLKNPTRHLSTPSRTIHPGFQAGSMSVKWIWSKTPMKIDRVALPPCLGNMFQSFQINYLDTCINVHIICIDLYIV